MLTVNMHEAKSKLSALVQAVESGREREVVLARNGKPAARLIRFDPEPGRVIFGLAQGEFVVPEDWDKYDKEIAAMFSGEDGLPNAAE